MKIVMLGHKYVPSREGGIEIVVEELSSRLVSLGHQVTIFNRKRKNYQKIDSHKGCAIEEVFTVDKKSLDAIIYSLFATLKIRKLIKNKKVDIVHYHAEGTCLFLNLLQKKAKRKGVKLIVTIHGLDWQRGKWKGFASKIIKKAERKIVKETYGRETNIIPNGVVQPEFHDPEIIKEKYGLTKNSYVLFLARIVPEKGVHYLIDAWKLVKKQINTNMTLVLAGGDSHCSDYFNEIMDKVKGDSSIITTGFVEGQELQELYSNAYLYVLPSDVEGMPISLLEALSYGNTCLVSDIPENTEVINEDCFVFKKGDVDRLRHQLKKIINLNINSHTDSIISYTWDEVVNRTLKIYRR